MLQAVTLAEDLLREGGRWKRGTLIVTGGQELSLESDKAALAWVHRLITVAGGYLVETPPEKLIS